MHVLLLHHALGVTPGVAALADALRAGGHQVAVPDLYEGRVFTELDDGVAHAESVGFDEVIDRGVRAADDLDDDLAVIGISLGVLPAQKLAQTRAGVRGAVLVSAAVPVSTFGDGWPSTCAVELHLGASDPWVDDDLDAARELAAAAGGELCMYPTDAHLFLDSSHADHEPELAAAITGRILGFLDGLEAGG